MQIEGTEGLKEWKGEYDFAIDGGAASTIALRSAHGQLPVGAIVVGGLIEVDTILGSGGAATVAVQSEAAGDLLAAANFNAAPWSTVGRKSIIPAFTGATSVKTTALRSPSIVIAAAALNAGKFRVVLFYR